jgi:hypothetical protein
VLQPRSLFATAAGASLLPPFLAGLVLGVPQPVVARVAAVLMAAAAAPNAGIVPLAPPPPPPMKECCVCFLDVPLDDMLILYPCSHRCVCEACAAALVAIQPPAERLCPKCRKHVIGASRVFDD